MAELVLYNYFRSSTSYRVRIALHYKNLSFDYKPVHLLNNGGEQHQEDYRSLNPLSEVPTLVHEGMPLSQSMAIIEYLDEMYPHPSLFPREVHKKARVRQFCENINSFMHPVCNLKVLQHLEKRHAYGTAEKQEWVHHWFTQGFEANEKFLKKTHGVYCFDSEITAADLFLVPQIFAAHRFNFNLDAYPITQKVYENCSELACFQKAHPTKQIDFQG